MFNRKKAKGQSLVEYGLILALVSIVCVGALNGLGSQVNAKINEAKDALTPAPPTV